MTGISTSCLHDRPLEDALEILSGMTDFVEIMDDGPPITVILQRFPVSFLSDILFMHPRGESILQALLNQFAVQVLR